MKTLLIVWIVLTIGAMLSMAIMMEPTDMKTILIVWIVGTIGAMLSMAIDEYWNR